ncbi:hypothetical protein TRAPUB_8155 [Trametes pubescens]|uniref:Uncharacterized protein n=1 Tax=Trametes pubescens TaxID=154538 RepID=A0A1M2W5Y3_TRAPU|nr:hypothetical protein TRAPUB_8155 [Trametes pubescens]
MGLLHSPTAAVSTPSLVSMDHPIVTFLPVESNPVSEPPQKTERGRLRRMLRRYVYGGLPNPGKKTGDPRASLNYSENRYAKGTVIKYGYKLTGWPKKIPFRNFNSLRGGNATLRMLICRWKDGKLRFERATPKDLELAKHDPSAILPGAAKNKPRYTGSGDVSTHSSSSPLRSTAALDDLPRHQRTDSKKPRCRDLTGPYICKNPLPKEGIKSKPYILDSDVEDDFGQPAAECGDFWAVEEPIGAAGATALGSLFGFFAYSPTAPHGRTSGTMRLWGSGRIRVLTSEAGAASGSE